MEEKQLGSLSTAEEKKEDNNGGEVERRASLNWTQLNYKTNLNATLNFMFVKLKTRERKSFINIINMIDCKP